ncbi:hypothetical protein V6N12_046526 [Hibiscus sabdariffa]|uniref:Uncharacterized protein n=1 Tax=Hibiscus sabdariffa TaxID=183260 RepID=A0ABR2DIW7_9ROSI
MLGCSGEYSDPIVIPAGISFSASAENLGRYSFLLISRSFQSELLQYNFLHLDPAAFGFCQGIGNKRVSAAKKMQQQFAL